HLPQGFQAGGAEPGLLVRAGYPAYVQRLFAQAMAVLQQQQALLGQLVQGHVRAPRKRVLPGHRQHERLLEQELCAQLVVVHRQGQDRRVQLALAQARQQLVALLLHQRQFQVREALEHARHHVRQQVRRQGGEDAQPHRARFRVLAAACRFLHLLDLGDDAAGAFGGLAPGGREHHLARRAFHQRHAQLVLQLADLGGQGRLADVAGRGRAAEVLVIGQGHQVFEVAQVHRFVPAGGRAGGARPPRQAPTSSAGMEAAGAEVRIRWSNAASEALAPSPTAITICLYGTVVQSPAANTPGRLVWPRSSTTISPRGLSSSVPLSHSVLGSRPICTKMPSSSRRWLSPPTRSLYTRPVTFCPSPSTSVVWALVMMVTFGRLRSLRCSTSSARSLPSNSSRVTWPTMPARSIAASTPELPPPITATRLPLNSGPSQCGQ